MGMRKERRDFTKTVYTIQGRGTTGKSGESVDED
jgi:hypothetical protein